MSKAMSYATIGVVAFLAGGFSFRLISGGEEGIGGPKHTEIQNMTERQLLRSRESS